MRTRKEQIEEMVQVNSAYLCHEDYTPDNLRMMLAAAISEAEERARAECAADTRRLDWLGMQDVVIGKYGTDKWKEVCLARYQRSMPADLADIRVTIDAAMESRE